MKRTTFLPLTALLAISLLPASTCYGQTAKKPAASSKPQKSTKAEATGPVIKTDVKVGDGAEATMGSTVTVQYTGWVYSATAPEKHGALFDSSRSRSKPFEFKLGAGQAINGWDEGITGMKVGGQRTLLIPGGLGYTTHTASGLSILPDTPLIFDIELLDAH